MADIYGLTKNSEMDQTESVVEIGRIRKGKKVINPKTGKEYATDLDHFRVTFGEGFDHHREIFEERYPTDESRREIAVHLAYPHLSQCYWAQFTFYTAGGMMGAADGIQWQYRKDLVTQKTVVKNGKLTDHGLERGYALEFDPKEPVGSWVSKDGVEEEIKVKPELRLYFTMPSLYGYFFMFVAKTHAYDEVSNLVAELRRIESKAIRVGYPLDEVPLLFIRAKEKVTRKIKGEKRKVDGWVLHVMPDPEWDRITGNVGKALSDRNLLALAAGEPPPPAEDREFKSLEAEVNDLPDGIISGEFPELAHGEIATPGDDDPVIEGKSVDPDDWPTDEQAAEIVEKLKPRIKSVDKVKRILANSILDHSARFEHMVIYVSWYVDHRKENSQKASNLHCDNQITKLIDAEG